MDPKFLNVPDENPKNNETSAEEAKEAVNVSVPVPKEPAAKALSDALLSEPSEAEVISPVKDISSSDEPAAESGSTALVEVIPGPILTPESVGNRDASLGYPKVVENAVPFYKDRNFWKNVLVIAAAVIVIGAIAGGVGYLAGKGKSEETTKKSKTKSSSQMEEDATSDVSGEATTAAPSGSLNIYGLRSACVKAGMSIVDDKEAAYDFMAFDSTMMVVVTLKQIGETDFDQLVTTMIRETTNVEADKLTLTANTARYEGLQDKEHAEYGYSFLELIYVDGYYVFVQGLGEKENDNVIISARNLASAVEKELGVS